MINDDNNTNNNDISSNNSCNNCNSKIDIAWGISGAGLALLLATPCLRRPSADFSKDHRSLYVVFLAEA